MRSLSVSAERRNVSAGEEHEASELADRDAAAAVASGGRPTRGTSGATERSGGHGRRSGLGRGLAALIPAEQDEEAVEGTRPLDVLFPGRTTEGGTRVRGGSARDLLVPGTRSAAKGRSSHPRPTGAGGVTGRGSGAGSGGRPARDRADEGHELFEDVLAEARTDGSAAARGRDGTEGGPTRTAKARVGSAAGGSGSVTREAGTSVPPVHGTGSPASAPTQREARPAREGGNVSRETSSVAPSTAPTAGQVPERSVAEEEAGVGADDLVAVPGATFAEVPTSWIIANHRQPREVFDEEDLEELAASIREVGVLQPVVVRPIDTSDGPAPELLALLEERPDARYELIMGERRLRASELAGLESVPAIVRRTEDADLLRDALLENLHRAQLNPLEEASAYQQLMADFGATQEELSRRIARSRPQIANTLRLLRLPPAVQRKVAAGVISAGHARALLSLESTEEMDALAERIVAEGLSVRTTEELVRLGQTRRPRQPRATRGRPLSPLGENLVSRLGEAYDTRVTITEGRTKGRIVIEFAGPEDLRRLAELMVPLQGDEPEGDEPNSL